MTQGNTKNTTADDGVGAHVQLRLPLNAVGDVLAGAEDSDELDLGVEGAVVKESIFLQRQSDRVVVVVVPFRTVIRSVCPRERVDSQGTRGVWRSGAECTNCWRVEEATVNTVQGARCSSSQHSDIRTTTTGPPSQVNTTHHQETRQQTSRTTGTRHNQSRWRRTTC